MTAAESECVIGNVFVYLAPAATLLAALRALVAFQSIYYINNT
jgi:hypothetical protein